MCLSLLSSCVNNKNRPAPTIAIKNPHSEREYAESNAYGPSLVCENAARYSGQQVGDGHCVSLIRQCTQAPFTSEWRPGKKVLGTQLPAGTIIATFSGQRYPSTHGHHAAIYIEQDSSGIWVWDQWRGKSVHRRLIKIRRDGADPGNTAQAYRVVRLEN